MQFDLIKAKLSIFILLLSRLLGPKNEQNFSSSWERNFHHERTFFDSDHWWNFHLAQKLPGTKNVQICLYFKNHMRFELSPIDVEPIQYR